MNRIVDACSVRLELTVSGFSRLALLSPDCFYTYHIAALRYRMHAAPGLILVTIQLSLRWASQKKPDVGLAHVADASPHSAFMEARQSDGILLEIVSNGFSLSKAWVFAHVIHRGGLQGLVLCPAPPGKLPMPATCLRGGFLLAATQSMTIVEVDG